MARIAYVNGRYQPIDRPAVAVEDRGYQFADGVYEVVKAFDGEPRDLERHLRRLQRSLDELGIKPPMSSAALRLVLGETLRRNALKEALVYIQVSRGTAPRNHLYKRDLRPNLVVTVRRARMPSEREYALGVGVITRPDERWARCDVKSISLLPNALAKQEAKEAGCWEAILSKPDGTVTEASSSNAWMVTKEGVLVTHPLSHSILGGITRQIVLELARANDVPLEERAFTLDEMGEARELFVTSTSSLVLPVVRVDERPVANGYPGEVTRRLQRLYADEVRLPPRFKHATVEKPA